MALTENRISEAVPTVAGLFRRLRERRGRALHRLAQKEIEPFCYDTNQSKHDEPERNHHVHICCHWNLPNAQSLEGLTPIAAISV